MFSLTLFEGLNLTIFEIRSAKLVKLSLKFFCMAEISFANTIFAFIE